MKTKTLFRKTATFLLPCLMSAILVVTIKAHAQTSQPVPQQANTSSSNKEANQFANSQFTYKIIDAPNKTFGYDIYVDGRKMIHQPSVPALPGNEGFKTKADAEKVAQLVIDKIKRGETPPTITLEEMKKLKVIK